MTRMVEVFQQVEPGRCHSIALTTGVVVVYSNRAPYKSGDDPNEDSLAIIQVDQDNALLIVADGVGGSPAGQFASGSVIEKLIGTFTAGPDPATIPALLISAVEDAHQDIKVHGGGSASTVALVHLQGATFRPAHAGDSIVMACGQRGKLKFETISHSPVGYALEAGVLSEDEAFTHEDRHLVSNFIGGQELHITLGGVVNLSRRDTVMLATDGVTDNLRQSEIIELIRKGSLMECGKRLAQTIVARMESQEEPGKPDDVTFILYRPSSLS